MDSRTPSILTTSRGRPAFSRLRSKARYSSAATNLAGDGQADLKNHGGIDKAVLAYSADHYPKWRDELRMPDMPCGAFGENLTIAGLSEESVCIGDLFRIGRGDSSK